MRDKTPFAAGAGSAVTDGNRDDEWWRTANLGECPITLECFSTLDYPPFALYHPGKAPSDDCLVDNHNGVSAYFDGLALASYIVSRGVFQNPLTRNELDAEDCRRLDRYLEDHCYGSNTTTTATTIFRGSRVISVAEAFALRNSVSVETTTTRSGGGQFNDDDDNERDRERIRTLQNAATAALAGLFVYGNDRQRQTTETTPETPGSRDELSFLLDDWGFDLSRRVEDTSVQGTHGYTVIDDDEAIAIASQRHAYETVQEAFPPLTEGVSRPPANENSNAPVGFSDERLMDRIRTMSVRDENEQKRHARELETAREQLLKRALERRRQRKKDRADRLARDAERHALQKKDEDDLEKARLEIEAWREDQWEKLRLLSEHAQRDQKDRQTHSASNSQSGKGNPGCNEETDKGGKENPEADVGDDTICDGAAEERKKAKAAAKRKRAKERKKQKKALERQEMEKLRLQQAEKARRAASVLKCNACRTGILKASLGFERFDQLFCSPKCARTAVKTR